MKTKEKQILSREAYISDLRKIVHETLDQEKFKGRYLDALAYNLAKGMIIGSIVGFVAIGISIYKGYKSFYRGAHNSEPVRIEQTTSQKNPYLGVKYIPIEDRTGIVYLDGEKR